MSSDIADISVFESLQNAWPLVKYAQAVSPKVMIPENMDWQGFLSDARALKRKFDELGQAEKGIRFTRISQIKKLLTSIKPRMGVYTAFFDNFEKSVEDMERDLEAYEKKMTDEREEDRKLGYGEQWY